MRGARVVLCGTLFTLRVESLTACWPIQNTISTKDLRTSGAMTAKIINFWCRSECPAFLPFAGTVKADGVARPEPSRCAGKRILASIG